MFFLIFRVAEKSKPKQLTASKNIVTYLLCGKSANPMKLAMLKNKQNLCALVIYLPV